MEQANVKFCAKSVKDGVLSISINGKPTLQRKLTDYPQAIQVAAMEHGFAQKLGDSVSSLSKGNQATAAIRTVQDLDAQLMAGMWNKPAGPVGPKEVFPIDVLAEGLLNALKTTPDGKTETLESVSAMLKAQTVEGRNAIAENPTVKAKVLEVQTAQAKLAAKTAPSLTELLAKLKV